MAWLLGSVNKPSCAPHSSSFYGQGQGKASYMGYVSTLEQCIKKANQAQMLSQVILSDSHLSSAEHSQCALMIR